MAFSANTADARTGTVSVGPTTVTVTQAAAPPPGCTFTLGISSVSTQPTGGSVMVPVTASSSSCAWTASTSDGFITVTSGTSGTGSGSVHFDVASNTGGARSGTVAIAGKTFVVNQSAPTVVCAFDITPTSVTVPTAGQTVTITVTPSGASCPWYAGVVSGGLTISGPNSGVGPGTVTVLVPINTGPAKTNVLAVANRVVTISQDAAVSCVASVSPNTANAVAAGQTVTLAVTAVAGSNCAWTAVVPAFVTIVTGGSGTGNGSIVLSVPANSGGTRSGEVVVGTRSVQLSQDASPACVTSVTPSTQTIQAAGPATELTVTAPTTCPWSPVTADTFFTPIGSVHSGNGSVYLSVRANTSSTARVGTVTVGDKTVSFTQLGATGAAVFSFHSDPLHPIGRGRSQTYTALGTQVQATVDDAHRHVHFQLSGTGGIYPWILDFAVEDGGAMGPGLVANALSWNEFKPYAGLGLSGDGPGCTPSGRFLVAEAVFSGAIVQRFHAVFEHHCDYFSPALFGEIWFDGQGSTAVPAMAGLPSASSPTSMFSVQGDKLAWILNGDSRSFTLANARFGAFVDGSHRINIQVDGGLAELWSMGIVGPGGQLPQPGTYSTESLPSSSAVAGLNAAGESRGCTSVGTLTILEAVYYGDEVLRFHATFTQTCLPAPTGSPSIRGEIYIVADPWRLPAADPTVH